MLYLSSYCVAVFKSTLRCSHTSISFLYLTHLSWDQKDLSLSITAHLFQGASIITHWSPWNSEVFIHCDMGVLIQHLNFQSYTQYLLLKSLPLVWLYIFFYHVSCAWDKLSAPSLPKRTLSDPKHALSIILLPHLSSLDLKRFRFHLKNNKKRKKNYNCSDFLKDFVNMNQMQTMMMGHWEAFLVFKPQQKGSNSVQHMEWYLKYLCSQLVELLYFHLSKSWLNFCE